MKEKIENNLKKPKLFSKEGEIIRINRITESKKSKVDFLWRFIFISVILVVFGYIVSLGAFMLYSGQEVNIIRFWGFSVAEIFAGYYFIVNLIYVTGYIESWTYIELSEERITYYNSSNELIFSKPLDRIGLLRFRTKKRKVAMSILPIGRTEGYELVLMMVTKFGRVFISGPICEMENWVQLERTKVSLKNMIRSGEFKGLQRKFGK